MDVCNETISHNNMPQMAGEKFYKEVLALDRDLAKKITFTSSNITEFLKTTGNPVLAKPFDPEQLIEMVSKENL